MKSIIGLFIAVQLFGCSAVQSWKAMEVTIDEAQILDHRRDCLDLAAEQGFQIEMIERCNAIR